ncbi:L-Aspartase-like protein [Microdochium trichocladiopsis]|uniref:L-Aspartase-like protein n=1 Tax=Microdochium trichocladiopsis TaxID=1682393 RepID=A0A9P8Y7W6_9PEZI|nr:L-Aspartase-like protein [Microdochium trichocladiopsis]KAH7030621.1 L-Aspartase-like protein [Microdochium trichocladiopsis]
MTTWVPPEASGYIHWGATTQDIMDLASTLQMKAGLEIVERLLVQLETTLRKMSHAYRDVPMAGRTHLQHALPITFGYKCAVWLSSIRRHVLRIHQLQESSLMVQFGGAAGTLASLGTTDAGIRVRKRLGEVLGLTDPVITWHVARDTVAEIINFLALVGGSLGKIALDLIIMSSNELNEVAEPYVPHRGASSTMPQKRNPISSEVILAHSKILRAQAGLVLDGMVSDFERASGPWHLEWAAIPTAFISVVGSLFQADFALAGLVVNQSAMRENLLSTRGLIVSEAVMMALAVHIGRVRAHDVVYAACTKTIDTPGTHLLDMLKESEVVTSHLGQEELSRLCDPEQYMGCCQHMVDDMLRLYPETAPNGISAPAKKMNSALKRETNGYTNGDTDGLSNGYTNGQVNGVH